MDESHGPWKRSYSRSFKSLSVLLAIRPLSIIARRRYRLFLHENLPLSQNCDTRVIC
jgi:hypothetical protein